MFSPRNPSQATKSGCDHFGRQASGSTDTTSWQSPAKPRRFTPTAFIQKLGTCLDYEFTDAI